MIQNLFTTILIITKARLFNLFLIIVLLTSCIPKDKIQHNKSIVFINHLYLYLNSSTYSDISNSDFLKEQFAYVETRTTHADSNSSWTGTYIYGQNTYIEFFDIGENENKGYTGIGFGVEVENGIDSLHKHFTGLGMENVSKGLRHRQIEDREIPWFYWLGFSIVDTTVTNILGTWVMEYNYEYMKYKFPDKNPDSLKITRKYYNQKSYRSDLLLKDIIEIEIALENLESNIVINELILYGYSIKRKEEKVICIGPEIKIIIIPRSKNKSGISKLMFSLTAELAEQKIITFGESSKLVINKNRTASWYFNI